MWDVNANASSDGEPIGRPVRSLTGHNHFVSDVVISSDGQFALSGSWDKTLRLWDINTYVIQTSFLLVRSSNE